MDSHHYGYRLRANARRSLFLAICLAALAAPFAAAGAQCLRDTRDVTFPDGSVKLRSYRCKIGDEAGAGSVTIEFHRLSEAAAGSLLTREPYPELDQIFGKPKLLKTAVGDEATLLFDRFGTRQTEASCYKFRADAPAGLKSYVPSAMGDDKQIGHSCGQRVLRYLSFPDQQNMTSDDLPLPRDNAFIRTTTGWPKDFAFHYTDRYSESGCKADDPIPCTLLWRAMTNADIQNYDGNMRVTQREYNAKDEWSIKKTKYLKLLAHVTRNGWPNDFVTVVGLANECGGGFDFAYHRRQMLLDVAMVQNTSSTAMSLDGLRGAATVAGLRAQVLAPNPSGEIAITKSVIAPGERVLIPLRIQFMPPESLRTEFGKPARAQEIHRMIQSKPAGTIFIEKGGQPRKLRKVRESFGAPTMPGLTVYTYGPEIALNGIVVNGKAIVPDDVSRNFLQLTAGEGYGSCPYLYAWDAKNSDWVRYGKVIHQAIGKAKEMEEERALHAFTSHIRLTEEELELSHIDKVALKVETKAGSIFMLKPTLKALNAKDGRYVRIYAGQKLDIDFETPTWLAAEDVVKTAVIITGYYERYSAIVSGR